MMKRHDENLIFFEFKNSKNHNPSKNQTNHSSDICLSLYGLSRVGTIDTKMKLIKETPCNCILCCKEKVPLNPVTQVTITAKDTINYHRIAGAKRYELSNHLGNVVSVITDRKISNDLNNDGATDYYEPEVVGAWDYYAFGGLMPGRGYVGARYRYGFNGKEKDDEIIGNGRFQDYGMRMYRPDLGRFFSVDPITGQYPELTPYQFASNTPIQAIDLDGLEAFPVHGTWSDPETFSKLKLENYQSIKETFENKTTGTAINWGGKNLDAARQKAAVLLVSQIRADMKDGEPITILGHSHGGNVGVLAVNIMVEDKAFTGKEINLLTINTPVREDYQLTEKAKSIIKHYNIFDKSDPVQKRGGNNPKKFVKGNKRIEIGERGGLFGLKMTGEHGKSGRKFDGAVNIKTKKSHGILGDFHNSHNRINEWKDNLKMATQKKK